ncbi:hypothetical protein S40288_00273 [Stachybotrys chartarum IBT 40288]|nr:hypothetical protein S40288_00273 [Stachybotrys chartarum IBT 40288]
MATVRSLVALLALSPALATAAPLELELNVTATTSGEIESDWTAVYYGAEPLLIGNNGGPDRGGFSVFSLDAELPETTSVYTGRTKLLTTVYDIADKDYLITIAQPDSIIRAFELPSVAQVEDFGFTQLGDWSALCSWKSRTGNQYLYLFGKKQGTQFLVRSENDELRLVEVQSFDLSFEASGCAVSTGLGQLLLSIDDITPVYSFPLSESTDAPHPTMLFETEDAVTSLGVYVSTSQDYILVAHEDALAVYSQDLELLGTAAFSGVEDLELQGLSVLQSATSSYPVGAIAFAGEGEDFVGFATASLDTALAGLGITENIEYDPRRLRTCPRQSPICDACSGNGYCLGEERGCQCFAGFAGDDCAEITCTDDCSENGQCVGPDICACEPGWGGLHCSFVLVEPLYETEANGGDGDDPAIWISPVSPEQSRIITTTKSTEGAGLGVFDLKGRLIQHLQSGEPNNVDLIYGFEVGGRTVDLAFAACRADDTLCLFEMHPNGTLDYIAGGIQPVVEDYTVYGSCAYRSPTTGKQYLFVNEKSGRYLQYELTATDDGELETTLVRHFRGGSGGQPEGCVTDEENGWLFLGEEPSALWRYGAEPDSPDEGYLVAEVGDGQIFGDVEGVTLVHGSTPDQGYVLVSCQGVSAYNIYRRAEPHDYVGTFTITNSANGEIDHVTNTDGIAAVGTALGEEYPHGIFVTHDDANELPDGTTSAEASFKIVSLEKILGADAISALGLLDEVDITWDPRAAPRP